MPLLPSSSACYPDKSNQKVRQDIFTAISGFSLQKIASGHNHLSGILLVCSASAPDGCREKTKLRHRDKELLKCWKGTGILASCKITTLQVTFQCTCHSFKYLLSFCSMPDTLLCTRPMAMNRVAIHFNWGSRSRQYPESHC